LAEKSSVFSSPVDGQVSLKAFDGPAGCDIEKSSLFAS
jgi:hypothetical protein